jgi:hypothetical protein
MARAIDDFPERGAPFKITTWPPTITVQSLAYAKE